LTEASANQVTSVTILNIANIRIKNNKTDMVSDLSSRHKLYSQIMNKRNISDIKRVRENRALSSNRNRRSISSMNNEVAIRRM
jgi:hypothetical protein